MRATFRPFLFDPGSGRTGGGAGVFGGGLDDDGAGGSDVRRGFSDGDGGNGRAHALPLVDGGVLIRLVVMLTPSGGVFTFTVPRINNTPY